MSDQQKPEHAPKEKKKDSSDTTPNRQVTRIKSYWLGHDPAEDAGQSIGASHEKGASKSLGVINRSGVDRASVSSTPLLDFDARREDAAQSGTSSHTPHRMAARAGASSVRWVQPKLKINMPGDRHEQEADRVAEEVVKRIDAKPRTSSRISSTNDSITAKANGAQTPSEPASPTAQPLRVQAKVSASASSSAATAGREAPPSIDRALNMPGHALPEETREQMEEAFGEDFGDVRVHTSAAAADSSDDIGARAFTVGRNIVFGDGQFRPGTAEGDRLLAHELAHVVQQGGNGIMIQRDWDDEDEDDDIDLLELENNYRFRGDIDPENKMAEGFKTVYPDISPEMAARMAKLTRWRLNNEDHYDKSTGEWVFAFREHNRIQSDLALELVEYEMSSELQQAKRRLSAVPGLYQEYKQMLQDHGIVSRMDREKLRDAGYDSGSAALDYAADVGIFRDYVARLAQQRVLGELRSKFDGSKEVRGEEITPQLKETISRFYNHYVVIRDKFVSSHEQMNNAFWQQPAEVDNTRVDAVYSGFLEAQAILTQTIVTELYSEFPEIGSILNYQSPDWMISSLPAMEAYIQHKLRVQARNARQLFKIFADDADESWKRPDIIQAVMLDLGISIGSDLSDVIMDGIDIEDAQFIPRMLPAKYRVAKATMKVDADRAADIGERLLRGETGLDPAFTPKKGGVSFYISKGDPWPGRQAANAPYTLQVTIIEPDGALTITDDMLRQIYAEEMAKKFGKISRKGLPADFIAKVRDIWLPELGRSGRDKPPKFIFDMKQFGLSPDIPSEVNAFDDLLHRLRGLAEVEAEMWKIVGETVNESKSGFARVKIVENSHISAKPGEFILVRDPNTVRVSGGAKAIIEALEQKGIRAPEIEMAVNKWGKLGKVVGVFRVAGKIFMVVGIGMDLYEIVTATDKIQKTVSIAAGWTAVALYERALLSSPVGRVATPQQAIVYGVLAIGGGALVYALAKDGVATIYELIIEQ